MSWAAQSYNGPAAEYGFELQSPPDPEQLGERPRRQVEAAAQACRTLVDAVGDAHVVVTAYGHAEPQDGPGDTLSISVRTIAFAEPQAVS